MRTFANPEGADYDRYELKLHRSAAGLVKEWADLVLFARHETFATGQIESKGKGISTGARVMHTTRSAAFDAKNRHGLPEVLPLSWAELDAALRSGRSPDALRAEVETVIEALDEATAAKARAALGAVGDDVAKLAELLNRVRARAQIAGKETTR